MYDRALRAAPLAGSHPLTLVESYPHTGIKGMVVRDHLNLQSTARSPGATGATLGRPGKGRASVLREIYENYCRVIMRRLPTRAIDNIDHLAYGAVVETHSWQTPVVITQRDHRRK